MINPYEKIIMLMRKQAEQTVPSSFTTGKMLNSTKCQIGDLKLTKDELLYLDGLSLSKDDIVLVAMVDEQYIVIGKVVEK